MLTNKLRVHERMWTLCSECVRKCVRWCQKHLCTIHTCICTGAQDTCLVRPHSSQQMQIHPRMCAYGMVQQLCCHGNCCKLFWVLSEHCTGCCLLHAHLPSWRTWSPDDCSLKKTIQIYASSWRGRGCVVTQASSDHARWCGPHPAGLWFALTTGCGAHPWTKSAIFAIFFAGLFIDADDDYTFLKLNPFPKK